MTLHVLKCRQRTCHCMGYTFPHRHGSRMCHHNPMSVVRLAQARGEPREVIEDILIEIHWDRPLPRQREPAECPF